MEGKQRGDCHCPTGASGPEQMMDMSSMLHYAQPDTMTGVGKAPVGTWNPDLGLRS